MMKTYCIRRLPSGRVIAKVDGRALDPRLDLWNHSPTGFEFGYGGSGPAQLSLAILANCLDGQDELAVRLHQKFKFRVIATMPRERTDFTITSDDVMGVVGDIQLEQLKERRSE